MNAWDAAAAAVGETAAASTSPPIAATVMLRILRAAFKDVLLVDATFPRQRLAGHEGPIIQVAAPDFHPDSAELDFYRRFRQAGGHLPLFGFDDADMVAALSSAMEADKSRRLVIYVECEPTLRILEVLRRIPTASLLVRGASGTSCAGLPPRGLLAIEIRQDDLQERYELVLPPGNLDATAERIHKVFYSFPGAFAKRRSTSWFGGVELVVHELELPPQSQPRR